MTRRLFLSFLCFLLALGPIHPTYADEDGDSNGTSLGGNDSKKDSAREKNPQYSHLFGGSSAFSIPLSVSKGAGSLAPSLSLEYSSLNGNGWVGWGWGLEVGRIVRKAKKSGVPIYDNLNDGDDDDNIDKFAISVNGISSDLVRQGGNTSHDYNTKFESFYKIQSFPGTKSRWEATAPDGSKYVFGESVAKSGASNQQFSFTHTWYLTKIINTNGNEIRFTYDRPADTTNGARYLKRIDYTYQSSVSTTSSDQYILFIREARSDTNANYAMGGLVKYDERLKEIQMYSYTGQLFKKYLLEYQDGNPQVNFQSPYCRLWKVTEYGKDNATSLPSFVISYTDRNAAFTENASWDLPTTLNFSTSFGNVDGDGLVDISQSSATYDYAGSRSEAKTWYRNTGDGTWETNSVSSAKTFTRLSNVNAFGPHQHFSDEAQLLDVNGDGLADFVDSPNVYLNQGNGIWSTTADPAWALPLPFHYVANSNPNYLGPPYPTSCASIHIGTYSCPLDLQHMGGSVSCPSVGAQVTYCVSTGCCYSSQTCGGISDPACPTGYTCDSFRRLCKATSCNGCTYGIGPPGFPSGEVCAAQPPGDCGQYIHVMMATDSGARFMDVNGDGYPDQVVRNATQNKVYLSQGNGTFALDSRTLPEQITYNNGYSRGWLGVVFADVNGDGLADVIKGYQASDGTQTKKVYINTGSGWTYDATFTLPYVLVAQDSNGASWDGGVRFTDINGDGIDDLLIGNDSIREVWIGTGRGWTKVNISSVLPVGFVTGNPAQDNQTRIVDVNGDGMIDLIQAKSAAPADKHTYLSTGLYPNLLKQVTLPTGGKVSFEYSPSTQLKDASGNFLNPNLPMSKQVVTKITVDNGRNVTNSTRSTLISYKNGNFDTSAREFAGFGEVTQTMADQTKVVTTFYQNPESWRGKEDTVKMLDSQGNELRKVVSTYQADTVAPYFTPIIQSDSYETSYNPTVTIHTRETYDYDSYGNNTRAVMYGDYDKTGDERTLFNEFYPNATKWIVQAPALKNELYDGIVGTGTGSNYFSREELTFQGNTNYDQQPNNVRVAKSLARGSDGKLAWTENTLFDSFGNILESKDALTRIVQTLFDTAGRFPTQVTNALNQRANSQFDYHGNLILATDVNQIQTSEIYDALHRPTQITSGPTVSTTSYNNWGDPNNQYTHKTSKHDGSLTLWTDEYFDGLGRTYRTIKNGIDSNHDVFIRAEFDNMGRPYRTYLPVFRTDYSPTGNGKGFLETQYDALSRPVKVIKPDKSVVTTTYSGWVTTVTDEKGIQKDFEKDAYGNVVKITEHTSNGNLVTTYEYDMANQLIEVRDPVQVNNPSCSDSDPTTFCNSIQISWDKLGHKTQMIDPDMGTWKYTYDTVGNLTDIIDAKGCWMHMSYDSLNRLTMKSDQHSLLPSGALACDHVTYTRNYDEPTSSIQTCSTSKIGGISCGPTSRGKAIGKVTSEVGPNYSREFFYQSPDGLGRLSRDDTNIDGVIVTNLYAYNIDGSLSKTTLNANDAANKIDVNYTYDAAGEIVSVSRINAAGSTQTILSSVTRNANGQPTNKTFGNNVQTNMEYYDVDAKDHRLKKLVTTNAQGEIQHYEYQYDTKGNLTQIYNAKLNADLTVTPQYKNYLYDNLDRLIHGGVDTNPIEYQYDPLGNITQLKSITNGYRPFNRSPQDDPY